MSRSPFEALGNAVVELETKMPDVLQSSAEQAELIAAKLEEISQDLPDDIDALSRCEVQLLIHSFEKSLEFLESRLECRKPAELEVAATRELIFLYDIFLDIYTKMKPARDKMLAANSPEPSTPAASEGGVRARLEDFESDEGETVESETYKAPKQFAMGTDADMVAESRAKERERLKRSEFIKALTDQYTDMPSIVDDGKAEMDAKSRRALKDLEEKEAYEAEQHHVLRPKDQIAYHKLKHQQALSTKGGTLGNLGQFVDRLSTNKDDSDHDVVKSPPKKKNATRKSTHRKKKHTK